MKKIILSPLLLFLLACHNDSTETKDLSKNNTAPKDYSADSIAKWTRNIKPNFSIATGDPINFTDEHNLKQGKWVTFTGKGVKTEFYKDGKLIENC